MAKVKTIVPGFNGYRANVRFVNGFGETKDPQLIAWFMAHGYIIEDYDSISKSENDKVEDRSDKIELENMSVVELKEYAKSIGKGKGVGVLKTKEQLIRHIEKE